MRYLTNSEAATMKRCARKWYFSHYRKLFMKAENVSETRTTGTLAHLALEDWYGGRQDPLGSVAFHAADMIVEQEAYLAEGTPEQTRTRALQNIEAIEKARDFALIIIEGYVQWLEEEGEDQHLELVSAEAEMAVPLPAQNLTKPVSLLAKLDTRMLDHRSNARVFMDHKVVQNFADLEKWAHLNPQFRFYGLVEYLQLLQEGVDRDVAQGSWTNGGILNMLRKVKRTSRSTPPYYKRREIRHSLIELQNFYIRIVGEAEHILQTEAALDSGVDPMMVCPPNPTRDCTWDCPYMTLCAFTDDGSDSEGYIQASFSIRNPLERYATVAGLESTDGQD